VIDLVETLKSNNIVIQNYLLGKFYSKITLQCINVRVTIQCMCQQPPTLPFEYIMYLCCNSRVNKCFLKCESKFSKHF
jgi:hypothetical protein